MEWLAKREVAPHYRDIKKERPSRKEIETWHRASGLPLKNFFNTRGQLYRQMELKERLPDMDEEEQYELLASDGLLVKRPILVGTDFVLVGFNEKEWAEKI